MHEDAAGRRLGKCEKCGQQENALGGGILIGAVLGVLWGAVGAMALTGVL